MSLISSLNPINFVANAAETICDAFNAPEWVGDLASGAINIFGGNYAGALEDGLDLLEGFAPAQTSNRSPSSSWHSLLPIAEQTSGLSDASKTSGTSSTAKAGGSRGETDGVKIAKEFLKTHQNAEDFTKAIANGEIPDEALNSPGGLMLIQQKLQQIQQMNQLMTQMLKSVHDMEMEIVRNIRT